jgi:hypothetical protein
LLVSSTSISAEPGISIAEPLAEVITPAMHVTWIATTEVHVDQQFVEPRHSALLLSALSPVHPGEDAAVALCKFLQVNPFSQGYGFTLCDASADVLKPETGRRCDHQTMDFAW